MDQLLAAYLAQLVEDAAHTLAGRYNSSFREFACNQALGILTGGQAGTLNDTLVEAACVATGHEPATIYTTLLEKAHHRAAALLVGQRKTYNGPAARTPPRPQAA